MFEKLLLTQLKAAHAHIEAAKAALDAGSKAIAAAVAIAEVQGQEAEAEQEQKKPSSNPDDCEHPEADRRELSTMGAVSVMCMACGKTLSE